MFSFLKEKIKNSIESIKDILKISKENIITDSDIISIENILLENGFNSLLIKKIKDSLLKNKEKNDIPHYIFSVLKEIVDSIPLVEEKKVVTLIGINGSGKTTTAIKIARSYQNSLLIAADTFRAAAQDQLRELATIYNVDLYEENNSEPGAVVFRGSDYAQKNNKAKIVIDTAGRIHSNNNLILELQKVQKIILNKWGTENVSTFIVLDSLQGRALYEQVKHFKEKIKIDGIILTKLDSLSKPGIIFSILEEYKIPLVYLCYGEHKKNCERFEKDKFISLFC